MVVRGNDWYKMTMPRMEFICDACLSYQNGCTIDSARISTTSMRSDVWSGTDESKEFTLALKPLETEI